MMPCQSTFVFLCFSFQPECYPRVGAGWKFCGRGGVAGESWCNFSVSPPAVSTELTGGLASTALPSLRVARWSAGLAGLAANTLLSLLSDHSLHWTLRQPEKLTDNTIVQ